MDDDENDPTLTIEDIRESIENVITYMCQIVNNNYIEGEKWKCEKNEKKIEEKDGQITFHVQASSPSPQRNYVDIRVKYDTDTHIVIKCTGTMHSPLHAPRAPQTVQLCSFGDILDFMIVHLCTSLCVPRAMYYIVHCMKLCVDSELVDKQIVIHESSEDGEFMLENPLLGKKCCLKMELLHGGVPTLHCCPTVPKGKPIKLEVPRNTLMTLVGSKVDYIQHAFCRSENIQYIQHPDVANALFIMLQTIGLGKMDSELREQAQQLLSQQPADTKKKSAMMTTVEGDKPSSIITGG